MPKNIVICCDGTNNKFGSKNTNVVKLLQMLEQIPGQQVSFYDPGVGTFSPRPMITKLGNRIATCAGLGLGFGLMKNVMDAYWYLMRYYEDGDRVYLFGFSRGAYTVRVLAAMLSKCGLLYSDDDNLMEYVEGLYRRIPGKRGTPAGNQERDVIREFRATFTRPCPVHFMGLWDTVSSVGWIWNPVKLPFTTYNRDVLHLRHAMAIDERRAFFKQHMWLPPNGVTPTPATVKQVWFAGDHSDVGGSHPEKENGLSKFSLEWMVVEAEAKGLIVNRQWALDQIHKPSPPDHKAKQHSMLKGAWWLLEAYPKKHYNFNSGKLGYRANFGRRRFTPDGATAHESVEDRIRDVHEYRPPNLPATRTVEPRVPY